MKNNRFTINYNIANKLIGVLKFNLTHTDTDSDLQTAYIKVQSDIQIIYRHNQQKLKVKCLAVKIHFTDLIGYLTWQSTVLL